MTRRIVFTSGKGGVGKTTVAAGIGVQLSRLGNQVVLVDADFGLNNVDVVTGLEKYVTFDLADVVEGRCRARQALVQHPRFPNFYILTGERAATKKYLSPQSLKIVLDGVAPQFDYILVDCPAGLENGFHRAVSLAEEGVVVTTPHISALRDADKVVSALKSYRLKSVELIVNMARGDRIISGDALSPAEIAEILKIPLLAALPEEEDAYLNTFADKRRAYAIAANNLAGGKRRYFDPTKEYLGVLGWLKRRLKG